MKYPYSNLWVERKEKERIRKLKYQMSLLENIFHVTKVIVQMFMIADN